MDYAKIIQDANRRKQELSDRQQQIQSQRTVLDQESQNIQRELAGLDELLESIDLMTNPDIPPDLEPLGFTDQIRVILQGASGPLTTKEIRSLLMAKGITGSSARNLLISVYTVITREKDKGNIERVEKDGKTAWVWKGIRRFPRTRSSRMRAFAGSK
jgi:hypothetical protein